LYYIIAEAKKEQREELIMRVQNRYLCSICSSLCGKTKSLEEILEERDNPKKIKTAEQIEKEVEEKFKKYLKG